MLSPEQRSIRARIGAYAMHSKHDPKATTAAASAAQFQRFIDEVDPERKLAEAERIRRAECARRAHMHRLALKASIAKRAKKKARGASLASEEAGNDPNADGLVA